MLVVERWISYMIISQVAHTGTKDECCCCINIYAMSIFVVFVHEKS